MDIYIGMRSLNHMVPLSLVFKKISLLFCTMTASISIPTNTVCVEGGGVPFSTHFHHV